MPVFLFHEGRERAAAAAFRQIAALSRGAYRAFDLASAERLKVLLGAIASMPLAAGRHSKPMARRKAARFYASPRSCEPESRHGHCVSSSGRKIWRV